MRSALSIQPLPSRRIEFSRIVRACISKWVAECMSGLDTTSRKQRAVLLEEYAVLDESERQ